MTQLESLPAVVPAARRVRLAASGIDYLLILGWLAVLTVAGLLIRPLLPASSPPTLLDVDLVAFGCTVFPVWCYLTLTETGPRAATAGKRFTHLMVCGGDGSPASRGRVMLRNAIKLLPWQLAHLAVARLVLDQQFGAAVAVDALSLLLVALTITMALRDPRGRALHDRLAGTRVVAAQ